MKKCSLSLELERYTCKIYIALYNPCCILSLDQNTFQAIIVSDGDYSYTIFTYKCGLMNWDNGATIGYNAGGDPYANNDPSSSDVACVNNPDSDWSNVIYQLSEDTPEDPPAGTLVTIMNYLIQLAL